MDVLQEWDKMYVMEWEVKRYIKPKKKFQTFNKDGTTGKGISYDKLSGYSVDTNEKELSIKEIKNINPIWVPPLKTNIVWKDQLKSINFL